MAASRWIVVVLLSIYTLALAFLGVTFFLSVATDTIAAAIPASQRALFLWFTWPQLVLWWAAVAAYIAALVQLGRARRSGFYLFAAGFALDLAMTAWMTFGGPGGDFTLSAGLRYVFLFAMLAVAGVLSWQKALR